MSGEDMDGHGVTLACFNNATNAWGLGQHLCYINCCLGQYVVLRMCLCACMCHPSVRPQPSDELV
jgi:hypothetical protein